MTDTRSLFERAVEKADKAFWDRTATTHHNYREPLRAAFLAGLRYVMEEGASEGMMMAAIRAAVTQENRGVEYAPAQGLRAMLKELIAEGER